MYKQVDVKFKLELSSGNAAFQDDATGEVSRILCEIAGQMDSGRTHGSCRDINGNAVGDWHLDVEVETLDEEDEDA